MDAELAPVLHVAPRTAQRTYETARTVCAVLPATWAAMRAGDLEPARAEAIAQEVPRLRPEVCAPVEQVLFPAVLGLPTARVRAAARRAVAVADPDEVARAGGPGPGRPVRPGPPRPGSGDERVGRRAAGRDSARRPGPRSTSWRTPTSPTASTGRLDQARADAMIDLILGQATITTTVDLNIPLSALTAVSAADRPDRPRRRRRCHAVRRRRRCRRAVGAPAAAPGARSPDRAGVGRWVSACCCRGSGSRRPGSG